MAIREIVTRGFGNGVFNGSIPLMVTGGYAESSSGPVFPIPDGNYNDLFGLGAHDDNISDRSHYRMQDNSATPVVVDGSSFANDGAIENGDPDNNTSTFHVADGPTPYLTGSLLLNNPVTGGPHINCGRPMTIGTGPFVMAAWFKAPVTIATSTLISYAQDGVTFSLVEFRTSVFGGFIRTSAGNLNVTIPTAQVNDGNWHSVVWTRDSLGVCSLWINFTLEGQVTNAGAIADSANDFRIGRRSQVLAGSDWWQGHACDGIFRDEHWSSAQIAEWLAGPEPVNVTPASAPTGTLQPGGTLTGSTDDVWGLPAPFVGLSNGTITRSTVEWWQADDAMGTNAAPVAGSQSSNTLLLDETLIGKHLATRRRGTNDGGVDVDTLSAWTAEAVLVVNPIPWNPSRLGSVWSPSRLGSVWSR